MKGETAYFKGQTDYRTGLVPFLCAMIVFKRDSRNQAAVYKLKVKTERSRLYLINFQVEIWGEINGEAAEWRERSLQMSRWSGQTGFTGTNFRLAKNEQQKKV